MTYRKTVVMLLGFTVFVSAISGCNAMGFTRVKTVTPSWGTQGNVAVDVYHKGGPPRTVEMRLFLDGAALGTPLRVSRGFPSMRNRVYKFRVTAPPGKHVLRAEIMGQDVATEKEFAVEDAEIPVYGLVTYKNLEGEAPKLWLEFGSRPLLGGFA